MNDSFLAPDAWNESFTATVAGRARRTGRRDFHPFGPVDKPSKCVPGLLPEQMAVIVSEQKVNTVRRRPDECPEAGSHPPGVRGSW
ncbi:hypothetical protein GCM10017567_59870 [Amycolatopsis bullii]|uniref:Uncharacterized protein n=1 Tax=Amycolatopsis bullii TaxID=941987 RepID=A0ABQ3KJL8_9PSEU|nr:hypothetical protein GCM10017567_59870 [Amycolatopsis bullii]